MSGPAIVVGVRGGLGVKLIWNSMISSCQACRLGTASLAQAAVSHGVWVLELACRRLWGRLCFSFFFFFSVSFFFFFLIFKCPLSYILGKKVLEELAHKFWSRKPLYRFVFIVTYSQWLYILQLAVTRVGIGGQRGNWTISGLLCYIHERIWTSLGLTVLRGWLGDPQTLSGNHEVKTILITMLRVYLLCSRSVFDESTVEFSRGSVV